MEVSRSFRLSARALRDVATILSDLHRGPNPELVDRVERQLFAAFADLARVRALGHRRQDLTERKVLFYSTLPYVVILKQHGSYARVLRVVHGARNLRKLL